MVNFKRVIFKLSRMSEWSGEWVHFSNSEIVGINPKQFHQDPLGIYLFPKEFKTEGQGWKEKKFKYLVEFKGGKVLDFQDITPEKAKEIIAKMIPDEKTRTLFIEEVSSSQKYLYRFYELVRQHFMGFPAKFNKALRDLGYDAVFDDTKTIHPSEVQLIVLNPSKIKVKGVELQKTESGFKEVTLVSDKLTKLLENYGVVSSEKPKKIKQHLVSRVRVVNGDSKATWEVASWTFRGVLQGVSVRLAYDSEYLSHQRSFGGHIDETLDTTSAFRDVTYAMDQIFKKKD